MLVDLNGYVATAKSVKADGVVTTTSRATLGDVRLLGGIVTLSGFDSRAVSSSDGAKGRATGSATFGTVTIVGQEFSFGPEGFSAAGQGGKIPGLPDDPAKALETLGVKLTIPKPVRKVQKQKATTEMTGLQVEIDTLVLAPVISQLPMQVILDQIPFPPEAAIVKSLLSAVPGLAPRLVLSLGVARSTVDTVQGIEPPAVPDPEEPEESEEPAAGGDTGGDTSGTGGTGAPTDSGAVPPTDPGAAGGGGAPAGDLPQAEQVAAGLPPLFSIPGMLLLGALALAGAAGSYLRKIGALALGGGVACPHGLDSGLPDLRKA